MKTSELTGAALDWAVAKCEGMPDEVFDGLGVAYIPDPRQPHFNMAFEPSTDWSQGGPIIERERINLEPFSNINGEQWSADGEWDSPTPLIAAMRCYVASKLGDDVDVPEELK
jgi:hypothetical protein